MTGTYHLASPRKDIIQRVNSLWTDGWYVILFTARGMNTYDSHVELIEEKYRQLTEAWLKDNRVCYDELKFGKPAATIYVDDKGLNPEEFLKWKDKE